jgi:hypothetical protein
MKPIYEIISDGCFTDGIRPHHPKDDYPYTLGRKVLYQQQVIINQGNIICLGDYTNEIIIVEATEEEYFFNFAKMPNREYRVIFRALEATTIKFPKHIIFNGELKTTTTDIKVRKDEELVIEVICARESGKTLVLVNINGYDSNGRILDDKTITDLKDSVSEIEDKLNEIDDLIDTIQSISGLEDLSEIVERINTLSGIVGNNTSDLDELKNRVNSISGKLETIGSGGTVDLTEVYNKINAISGIVDSLESCDCDLTGINNRLDEISGAIGNVDFSDINNRIDGVSGKLETLSNLENPADIINIVNAVSGNFNVLLDNLTIKQNDRIITTISGIDGRTVITNENGIIKVDIDDSVFSNVVLDDGEW